MAVGLDIRVLEILQWYSAGDLFEPSADEVARQLTALRALYGPHHQTAGTAVAALFCGAATLLIR